MRLQALLFLALILCGLAAPAHAEPTDYQAVAEEIVRRGDAAVAGYDPTDGLATSQVFSRMYFGVFESSGFEFRLGAVDNPLLLELEKRFGSLVRGCARGAPRQQLETDWAELRTGIMRAARLVAASEAAEEAYRLALQAILALLRIALPAILVLAGLVTALRRGGAGDRESLAWIAFTAGLAGGVAAGALFVAEVDPRAGLAGISLVAAAAGTTALAGWAILRSRNARLEMLLEARSGPGLPVALAAAVFLPTFWATAQGFLIVAGMETGGEPQMVAAIGGGAAACLVALYAAVRRLSLRLAPPAALRASAALLAVTSILLAVDGVRAL